MARFLLLLLAGCLLTTVSPAGATSGLASAGPPVIAANSAARLPGMDLAEGISQLTGVAISPLLGMSAVGAWRYYQAPAPARAYLPWFCHPYVWGPALLLFGLCFLKDLLGTATPAILKKPFDVLELFESKASALVACTAFLPYIVSEMAHPGFNPAAPIAGGGLGSAAFGFDWRILTVPLAMVGFAVVWIACHAINVLIVLSPFSLVDGLLKLIKGALLGLVVASSFASPMLGAAVSLTILAVAWLVAPWAFRLTVFGTLFGLDVLLPGRGRRRARPEEPQGFLARPLASVPVRTLGRLTRAPEGAPHFSYRPWLILPPRQVPLPSGSLSLARGVLHPSLLVLEAGQARAAMMVTFLPRYRSHEQTMASHFAIESIVESPLLKGFHAIRTWLREVFTFGRSSPAP